jgi:hypothetical protein
MQLRRQWSTSCGSVKYEETATEIQIHTHYIQNTVEIRKKTLTEDITVFQNRFSNINQKEKCIWDKKL